MIKIYAESVSVNVTLFKNEMFEHTSKEIEKIIRSIKKMDDKDVENMLNIIKKINKRRIHDHSDNNIKLVIELSLVDDDIDH